MEIDNYRNFLAIVEAGSMTAASEYIHIAQPALSKQMRSHWRIISVRSSSSRHAAASTSF